MGKTERVQRLVVVGAVALVVVWSVLALWVVPAAIRAAYAGSGPGFLNRLISGQSEHSVEIYLAAWRHAAALLTATLIGTSLLAGLAHRFRDALGLGFRNVVAYAVPPKEEPTGLRDILAIGLSSGVAFGILEWLVVLGRRALSDWAGDNYSTEAFWMVPAGTGGFFLLMAASVASLSLLVRERDLRRITLFLCIAVGFYGLLAVGFGGKMNWGAALTLAMGATYQAVRALFPQAARHPATVRRAAVALTSVVVITALARTVFLNASEAYRLRQVPTASQEQANVLLIVLDVVRAEDMSLYGYDRPTTPFLERWARGGVTFERAIAPAPWTLPSHAALFSGRIHRPASWQSPLDWQGPTLAQTLTARGYATGGFMANLYYGTKYYGLQRGFIHYEGFPRSFIVLLHSSWVTRSFQRWIRRSTGTEPEKEVYKTAADVNDAFLAWLDGVGTNRPFFAFLNYIDAHAPYVPPAPFDRRFSRPGAKRIDLKSMGSAYQASELEELRAGYDGAIAYMDSQLERLMGELEKRGLSDDMLVVVTADHGEEFLEHGVMGHAMSLFIPSLHVPLVIKYPGRIPAGLRVPESVPLADVPATIADLLGWSSASPFPGSSLVQVGAGELGTRPASRPIYSETLAKPNPTPDWYPIAGGGIRSLVFDRWHFIRYEDGREQLFDLVSDPLESDDLALVPPDDVRLDELRAMLDAEESAVQADLEDGRGGR